MKKEIRISQMCSQLQDQYYKDLELESQTCLEPCLESIKKIAFDRLREQEGRGNMEIETGLDKTVRKGYFMKRKVSRVALVAAIICVLGATAFAATGGMQYFKSIFGDSVQSVEGNIWLPMISASDDNYKMTVESMLTDGYKTDIIVSLENLKGGKIKDFSEEEGSSLFTPDFSVNTGMGSYYNEELPEFAQKSKKYYHLNLAATEKYEGNTITLALSEKVAPLKVEVKVEESLGAKVLKINQGDGNYTIESIQLSPLGVLVIGNEKNPSGGLPTGQIDLVMKDGTREELISKMSFDSGGVETVGGGGGAVVGAEGESAPLVTQTQGLRNPDGKVITTGTFSRLLNLNEVKSIFVDGTEYFLTEK